MFPGGVLNRLNITDVNTDSKPIKAAATYATSPNVVLYKPSTQQSTIFNTVSDGISSNFTDAGVRQLNNFASPTEVLNKKPIDITRLPDPVPLPKQDKGLYVPPPPEVFIPKTPIYNISGIKKLDQTQYEQFSANFAKNKPTLLFVMDYIVDGQKIGNLIVFQKYQTASHYEVYKRNIFTEINSFQRILFLNSSDLLVETRRYNAYIKGHLGLDSLVEGSYFVVMDPLIREDRIYEYKVVASRVPQNAAEVDYDYILEAKKMIRQTAINTLGNSKLEDFCQLTFSSKQLGWIVALVNRELEYFGTGALLHSLRELITKSPYVLYPSDINVIKKVFDDSVALFGIDSTVEQIINLLGGLPPDFRNSFNESLNKINHTFSYDKFITSARQKVPVFKLLFTISEHKNNEKAKQRLSQLNIVVPTKVGAETYTSLEGLTNIFYFINNIIFVIARSQDNSKTLEDILRELETPPPPPPAPPSSPPPPPPPTAVKPVTTVTNPNTITPITRVNTDTRLTVNTGGLRPR